MPSSAVRTFTDPDEYAGSIRQGTVELTITERGNFTAKLTRINLHRLWMQRFSESLPRISHVAGWGGRAVFVFRAQFGPRLLRSGIELAPNSILRHSEGESYYHRSCGVASYASMSLPVADMASAGAAIAGIDLTPPPMASLVTASPSAMAKLQRLHAAVGDLAEKNPELIAHPEVARGLEQALIEALVRCLDNGAVDEDRAALRRHTLILRRFHQLVEKNADQPIYITELCKAIGVSDRTLRVCCEEQLGINPKRYLTLRRMHLARRALRDGAPAATTVTEIATQFGFWQFGRFAGEYKSLFGETPSATLSRRREY
jgi:AraC-like DNA-binding protein